MKANMHADTEEEVYSYSQKSRLAGRSWKKNLSISKSVKKKDTHNMTNGPPGLHCSCRQWGEWSLDGKTNRWATPLSDKYLLSEDQVDLRGKFRINVNMKSWTLSSKVWNPASNMNFSSMKRTSLPIYVQNLKTHPSGNPRTEFQQNASVFCITVENGKILKIVTNVKMLSMLWWYQILFRTRAPGGKFRFGSRFRG